MRKVSTLFTLLLLATVVAQAQDYTIRADKKGRLGYFNEDDKEVIKCQFDEAEPFINGVARVCKDEKYGLINEKGKWVTDKFTVMEQYAGTDHYIVADGGKMVDVGEKVKTRANIPARIFKGSTAIPVKGAKWGIIDRYGHEIIKPDYDELSSPIHGVIYVIQGGKMGYYNDDYNLIVKPEYTFMGTFNDRGICWVNKGGAYAEGAITGGKMSLIDRGGRLIIPLKYSSVYPFIPVDDNDEFPSLQAGLVKAPKVTMDTAEVKKKVKSASLSELMQMSNQLAEQQGLMRLTPFQAVPDVDHHYLWFASKPGVKPGIIESSGRILVPEKKYDQLYLPTDGMAKYVIITTKKKQTTYQWGFYDTNKRKAVTTPEGYRFTHFYKGISRATKEGGGDVYFVDTNLQEVSKHYTEAGAFAEDYCMVGDKDRFGLIDYTGKEVIPLTYAGMNNVVSEGKIGALDAKTQKWGHISTANETVIPFAYDGVGNFKNGIATAKKGDRQGVIDDHNKVVVPFTWKAVKLTPAYPTDYFWVMQDDDLYYYYDMNRSAVAFPQAGKGYKTTDHFNDEGYARVSTELYGAVSKEGGEVVPCAFEKEADVDRAFVYMREKNIVRFKDVDLQRFKIVLRGTSNSHKLSEVIAENEWDY